MGTIICSKCNSKMYLFGNCQKSEIVSVYDSNDKTLDIFKCEDGNIYYIENKSELSVEQCGYRVERIGSKLAKEYIKANHYSHGCHNGPSPCYGLFDGDVLIGAMMFATPCSENVRASVFGEDYKDWVTELHRLHILDVTPKNTESWFISRCLKLLKQDKPQIRAVISFSDSTEGHEGTIYKATNAYRVGHTGSATFFIDQEGRLRHPHQCGVNITPAMGKYRGWTPVKRGSKNRYLYLLATDKREKKMLIKMCKLLNKPQSN